MKMRTRTKITGLLLLIYITMAALLYTVHFLWTLLTSRSNELTEAPVQASQSRHLLGLEANCSPAAVDTFPRPFISTKSPVNVLVYIIIATYAFLSLAILTDDFFLPALERIVQVLKIKPDVAGATFMAAGSSAPELGTGLIAVFVTKDDIGVGTVVGSAVYNVAFVVAMCGLFAGKVTRIKKWSLCRDCFYYFISIVTLLVIMWDRKVEWMDATVMMILYVLYLVAMYKNEWLEKRLSKGNCFSFRKSMNLSQIPTISANQVETVRMAKNGNNNHYCSGVTADVTAKTITNGQTNEVSGASEVEFALNRGEEGVLDFPEGKLKRALWIVSLPILLVFSATVPNCRIEKWKNWFIFSFLMSCVWISGLTYLLVWMISIIGHMWRIPDCVTGLTFLAAGASVPDSLASIFVAREGQGNMAISNALGSNVFDILVCLGLPWFLQTVIVNPGSSVPVYAGGLVYTNICLLATTFFLVLAMRLNQWRLDKKFGGVMLIWYFLFMTIAIMYQLNVFSYTNLPTCHSDV